MMGRPTARSRRRMATTALGSGSAKRSARTSTRSAPSARPRASISSSPPAATMRGRGPSATPPIATSRSMGLERARSLDGGAREDEDVLADEGAGVVAVLAEPHAVARRVDVRGDGRALERAEGGERPLALDVQPDAGGVERGDGAQLGALADAHALEDADVAGCATQKLRAL